MESDANMIHTHATHTHAHAVGEGLDEVYGDLDEGKALQNPRQEQEVDLVLRQLLDGEGGSKARLYGGGAGGPMHKAGIPLYLHVFQPEPRAAERTATKSFAPPRKLPSELGGCCVPGVGGGTSIPRVHWETMVDLMHQCPHAPRAHAGPAPKPMRREDFCPTQGAFLTVPSLDMSLGALKRAITEDRYALAHLGLGAHTSHYAAMVGHTKPFQVGRVLRMGGVREFVPYGDSKATLRELGVERGDMIHVQVSGEGGDDEDEEENDDIGDDDEEAGVLVGGNSQGGQP
jgi:hypothetical protein